MATVLKALGILGLTALAVAILALIVLPAPWFRGAIYAVIDRQALSGWREGAAYATYLTDILLIFLVGGFVFSEGIVAKMKNALAHLETTSNAEWARVKDQSEKDLAGLLSYSAKLARLEQVTGRETRNNLSAMLRLNLVTYHPRTWARWLVRIFGYVPGGLYGTLALVLVAIKIVAEMVLILAG